MPADPNLPQSEDLVKQVADRVASRLLSNQKDTQREASGSLERLIERLIKGVIPKPVNKTPPPIPPSFADQSGSKKTSSDKSETNSFLESLVKKLVPDSTTKSVLESKKEIPTFLLGGYTPDGLKQMTEKLPEAFKKGFLPELKNILKTNLANTKSNIGLGLLGFGALILGVLTLIDGIMDSGPFKGLKKLLGKGLLAGGAMMVRKAIGGIIKSVTDVMKLLPRKMIKSILSVKRVFTRTIPQFLGKLANAPIKLIKDYGRRLLGIFGGGVGKGAAKAAAAKGGGFIAKFLGGMLKFLKKVPFIGSLITIGFAVSRFRNGDVVGGGIEVLSGIAGLFPGIGTGISLALDALNAFLDIKAGGSSAEASKTKGNMIMDWIKSAGGWIWEKMQGLPLIGNLIKSVGAFSDGNWLEGLNQLARATPQGYLLGMAADFLNQKDDSGQSIASKAFDFVGSAGKWIWEKLRKTPLIGNLISSVEAFVDSNWLEGLNQLARATPMGYLIGMAADFLNQKDDSGQSITSKAFDWATAMTTWLEEKLHKLPVIGKLMDSFQLINKGKITEGLKQLPILGSIITWFSSDDSESVMDGAPLEQKKSLGEIMRETIMAKFKSWWKSAYSWVKFAARKVLPDDFVKQLDSGDSSKSEGDGNANSMRSMKGDAPVTQVKDENSMRSMKGDAPVTQVKDAIIKPNGGLVVSSPKEGALMQLSPMDGILAAPLDSSTQGPSKSVNYLSIIAKNTRDTNDKFAELAMGFGLLADGINRVGKSLNENFKNIPTNILNMGLNSPQEVSSGEVAQRGNRSIADFRNAINPSVAI